MDKVVTHLFGASCSFPSTELDSSVLLGSLVLSEGKTETQEVSPLATARRAPPPSHLPTSPPSTSFLQTGSTEPPAHVERVGGGG